MNKLNVYYNKMQELDDMIIDSNTSAKVKKDARKERENIFVEIKNQDPIFMYMYNEFVNSQELGNIYIDLGASLWADQVEDYVTVLKNNDIRYFTISDSSSGLIKILAEFQKFGCNILGTIQIKSHNHKIVPALKLEIL